MKKEKLSVVKYEVKAKKVVAVLAYKQRVKSALRFEKVLAIWRAGVRLVRQ
jgi:hypothetical protein